MGNVIDETIWIMLFELNSSFWSWCRHESCLKVVQSM